MKCENFLPWLESGSYVRAALARQHARRCESCRAAARLLDDVKQELTASDPLPERLKQTFLTAGEASPVSRSESAEGHLSRAPLWLAALAATLLIAVTCWKFGPRRQTETVQNSQPQAVANEQRSVGPITIVVLDQAAELSQLEANLAVLESQLQVATNRAQRLAAEAELARVLVDYHHLLAGGDSK